MKHQFLVVCLCHLQHVLRFGEENVTSPFVLGHVLCLVETEIFQFLRVESLDPASLVKIDIFPATGCAVLVQQTVLDDLELERADGSDNLAVVELVREQLGHALVHELVDTLGQLLGFHGVGVLDIFE